MDKKMTPKKKMIAVAICAALLLIFLYCATYLTERKTDSEDLAEQLAEALSQMRGVGDVSVVIHYAEKNASAGASLFGQETASEREIRGALIVAEGAEEIGMRVEMMRAAATLLDVEQSRIEIIY